MVIDWTISFDVYYVESFSNEKQNSSNRKKFRKKCEINIQRDSCNIFYEPLARKLVFTLQLRVA